MKGTDMRLKGIFLFLALWGFGATAFAIGAGAERWWFAVAGGALTILALMGAVLAEFAEEYRRRGVTDRRQMRVVNERLDGMESTLGSTLDALEEITAYLHTIAEAQLILHPPTDLLPSGPPVVKPFAPIPPVGVRG